MTKIHEPKALFYTSEDGSNCVIHARVSRGRTHIRVDRIDLWLVDHKPHGPMDAGDIAFADMAFNETTRSWDDYNVQSLPSRSKQ